MRTLAGPSAHVHFTHMSESAGNSLHTALHAGNTSEAIADASCHRLGVLDLMKREGVPLEKVCLLDPKAPQELSPDDGDGRFSWFLFGVRALLSINHEA